jgi:hypothetical protein
VTLFFPLFYSSLIKEIGHNKCKRKERREGRREGRKEGRPLQHTMATHPDSDMFWHCVNVLT